MFNLEFSRLADGGRIVILSCQMRNFVPRNGGYSYSGERKNPQYSRSAAGPTTGAVCICARFLEQKGWQSRNDD